MTVYDTSFRIDLLQKIAESKTSHNPKIPAFPREKSKYSNFGPMKL